MTDNWEKIIRMIEEKELRSPSWQSDKKTLLELFDKIQILGIDPSLLLKASYSNLRTIIPPLRKAVKKHDLEKITSLFEKASALSNIDLRLFLETTVTEIITVREEEQDQRLLYTFSVDKSQFERIRNSTKLYFDFKVIGS